MTPDEALDLLDRCYHSPAVSVVRAEVERLRQERDHFRDCISAREVRALVDERDKLQADLAAARADAERYRWLRSAQTGKPLSVVTTGSAWRCTLNTVELDEAIDAALKEQK